MISFLNPLYLLLLPLAALPILLNLVKRRVRLRVRFPSIQLLKIVEERRARRRPRWQEILLLALRVAAVLLLVLMLAGPRLTFGGAAPPRAVVVVVDNSPSMAYVEDGEARLARAVRYARSLGRGANDGDLGAVVGTGPAKAQPAWGELSDVAAGLSGEASAGGRLADALAKAREMYGAAAVRGRVREVAIFTDMQREAFAALPEGGRSLPPGVRITFYDVRSASEPAWNVALTAFRVLPAGGGSYEVVVDVRQYGRPRPLTVEEVGGGADDVTAGSWGQARFGAAGGRRYDFACRGGYGFDDRVSVELPVGTAVGYDVAAGTPGGRTWAAAFEAVGMEARAADSSGAPGVYVMPLSAWRSSRRGASWAERGFVVVVVPDDATGGRFDDGTVVAEFVPGRAQVAADPSLLPNAARAGRFEVAGYMEVSSGGSWLTAAAATDGTPVILSREMGKGTIFMVCVPAGRDYSDLFTSVTFVGLALDLNLKAIERAQPGFAAARSFETAESDPAALGEDEVRVLFPGAAVTRNAPADRRGRSVPLQSHAAAAVFLVLAAEALLASYRPSAKV
jgi:hypothetical protein